MKQQNAFWSRSEIARLKKLILMGYSAAQIAERIGCTRKAVIGKAFRAWGGFTLLRESESPIMPPTPEQLARQEAYAAEEAERQRLRDEDDAKYQVFAEREPGDNTCSYTGCKMARQANRFQLCAAHDQERIRTKVAA